MKKIISIISVILVFTMFFSINAYAVDNAWETDIVDISGDFDSTISISKCSVSGIKTKTYSGSEKTQSPVVKYGKQTLVKGTHYTLSYKNNKYVGTATVIIKGKGIFEGSIKKTFKIIPKTTKITKLSKPKSKQIKVSWSKQTTQTTGYQIQYALNSKFTKSAKKVTVSNRKTTSKTIKSLKKKTKYYVRIRTYKEIDGKRYYSSWSHYSKITTK